LADTGTGWSGRAWRRVLAMAGDRRGLLKVIIVAAVGLGSSATGAVAAAWTRACVGTCPTAESIAGFAPRQTSLVLDARGTVIGQFSRERRTLTDLDSLPRHVPMAFVAIEDRRFFEHEGVDPLRLLVAIRDNLIRGWGGPGGSTISMQLARNLFPQQLPRNEKSVRRKVAEIRLAMDMERSFSKGEILKLYLDHIYLGAGAYGIEAAARTYFAKPARALTPLEAATIAGLPQAPTAYNPRNHPDRALARRALVLDAMARERVITRAEAAEGRAAPLGLAPPGGALRAPYFVESIRRELEARFGELLYTGGLRIHTALDPELQATAEAALEERLRAIESGRLGPFRGVSRERFEAGLEEGEPVTRTPYLQGATVVLDPHTGLVRAMVGGRDFRHSQFNRATQALRQPGSAFKPFVYATALEKGRSPLYGVSDEPLTLVVGNQVWSPKNYDGSTGGMTTMRGALRNSRNLPTIRIGNEVGVDAVRDLARRTGLETPIPGYPSVFIGAAAVYPIDMIGAYAAFANGGWRVEPRLFVRIENSRGEVLWQPSPPPQRAVDPGVAFLLTDMLREALDRGTGYAARNPAIGNLPFTIPAAGKTGTTNDATDVWFIGYTPDLIAGVWIGFDTPQPIMRGATGGTLAVPIWARVMRTAYEGREPPAAWQRPDDVVSLRFSGGVVLSADCPGGTTDLFVRRYAPAPDCPRPDPSDLFVDPTPELPGRPVFPGQPRVPFPEDFVNPPQVQRDR
jgi:penicillin-binding protein 1A